MLKTDHETENTIANMMRDFDSELGEIMQGVVGQRYYVEVLLIDDKFTATIHDKVINIMFDANLDVSTSSSEPQHHFVAGGIFDDAGSAVRAVADYVAANDLFNR